MANTIKLRFKIGNIIEFEAEGTTEDVETQKRDFMETVFPAAVEAVKVEQSQKQLMPLPTNAETLIEQPLVNYTDVGTSISEDLSRTNLSSYIKKFGDISDQDFVLIAVYFNEKKNGVREFSTETVKQFYLDARRQEYSNYSVLIRSLIKKGLVMDVASADEKNGKFYMLTDDGLRFVENYQPKEANSDKKNKKPRKPSPKIESQYASLTADDLNLHNYPKVKDQKQALNQLILSMFIIVNENRGEWFSFIDIEYIYTHIFEIPYIHNTVKNIINSHKSWFISTADDRNKKASKYKILSGAKDFATSLIKEFREKHAE